METVPQSWKRRGNGRETNGKRVNREAIYDRISNQLYTEVRQSQGRLRI